MEPLPARHPLAGRDSPLDAFDRDGWIRQHRPWLQPRRRQQLPVHLLHDPPGDRCPRHTRHRGVAPRWYRFTDPQRRPLGRLLLDGARSGGRLHLLVHHRVPRDNVQPDVAHRFRPSTSPVRPRSTRRNRTTQPSVHARSPQPTDLRIPSIWRAPVSRRASAARSPRPRSHLPPTARSTAHSPSRST